MPKAVGRCGEFSADACIGIGVVSLVILELVVAQQRWEEFVVGDVLNQGHHRGSGLLIDLLVVEAGIRCADLIS